MPSNMLAIDSNFPTFTGEEPVEEQIRELVNYLYQLRESLQYSLQNLSAENFNVTALDQMNEDAQKKLVEQLQKMANELSTVKSNVDTLMGRLSVVDNLSGRMTDVEADVAALQTWSAYQEEAVGNLENRADSAEEELAELKKDTDDHTRQLADLETQAEALDTDVAALEAEAEMQKQQMTGYENRLKALEEGVQALGASVQLGEDGRVTLGEEGRDVHLVGNIYINGVLFEQGESNETT